MARYICNVPSVVERLGQGVMSVMKFYTVKLPKFIGGMVKALLGVFKKN